MHAEDHSWHRMLMFQRTRQARAQVSGPVLCPVWSCALSAVQLWCLLLSCYCLPDNCCFLFFFLITNAVWKSAAVPWVQLFTGWHTASRYHCGSLSETRWLLFFFFLHEPLPVLRLTTSTFTVSLIWSAVSHWFCRDLFLKAHSKSSSQTSSCWRLPWRLVDLLCKIASDELMTKT